MCMYVCVPIYIYIYAGIYLDRNVLMCCLVDVPIITSQLLSKTFAGV